MAQCVQYTLDMNAHTNQTEIPYAVKGTEVIYDFCDDWLIFARDIDNNLYLVVTEIWEERTKQLRQEANTAIDAYVSSDGKSPLTMSSVAFHSIHKDFRSTRNDQTHPSCLVNHHGTCLVPVTFSKK